MVPLVDQLVCTAAPPRRGTDRLTGSRVRGRHGPSRPRGSRARRPLPHTSPAQRYATAPRAYPDRGEAAPGAPRPAPPLRSGTPQRPRRTRTEGKPRPAPPPPHLPCPAVRHSAPGVPRPRGSRARRPAARARPHTSAHELIVAGGVPGAAEPSGARQWISSCARLPGRACGTDRSPGARGHVAVPAPRKAAPGAASSRTSPALLYAAAPRAYPDRGEAAPGASGAQPVMAPCAAEPTSLAYLPSTPVV